MKNNEKASARSAAFKNALSGILLNTCVFYTVFSVAVIIAAIIISGGFDTGNKYISSVSFMFFLLPCSLIFGIARKILLSGSTAVKRYVLHAVLCIGGFICTVVLPMRIRGSISGSTALVVSVLFCVIYAAVMAVRGIIISSKIRKSQTSAEYQSIYNKKK